MLRFCASGRHYAMLLNMQTTSGLLILVPIISLPDASSFDNNFY